MPRTLQAVSDVRPHIVGGIRRDPATPDTPARIHMFVDRGLKTGRLDDIDLTLPELAMLARTAVDALHRELLDRGHLNTPDPSHI